MQEAVPEAPFDFGLRGVFGWSLYVMGKSKKNATLQPLLGSRSALGRCTDPAGKANHTISNGFSVYGEEQDCSGLRLGTGTDRSLEPRALCNHFLSATDSRLPASPGRMVRTWDTDLRSGTFTAPSPGRT